MIQLCLSPGICLLAKNVKSCQQGEKLYLPAEVGEKGSLPSFLRLTGNSGHVWGRGQLALQFPSGFLKDHEIFSLGISDIIKNFILFFPLQL